MRKKVDKGATFGIRQFEEEAKAGGSKERVALQKEHEKRLKAMAVVGKKFRDLQPGSSVLRSVRAVPTCLIDFDFRVGVGGLPIERFSLVHGPSGMGKSKLVLALIRSFLARDHFALFLDAERTTPKEWAQEMLGPHYEHPGFYAKRPESYEQARHDVRDFCLTIAKAKDDGAIDEATSGIIVVDSIRKLVPKGELDEIMKNTEKDPGKRGAQIRALMNAAWLDELVPLLERAALGMVVIARETEDTDPNNWLGYKVGGGTALYFDASLAMRVERAGWVTKGESDDDKKIIYGERHRITIRKTKVAGREDKTIQAYFHTSNGVLEGTPLGLDPARDVLDVAEDFGIVTKAGSWYAHNNERLGNGRHNAVKALYANPNWLAAIEREVRAQFKSRTPEGERVV